MNMVEGGAHYSSHSNPPRTKPYHLREPLNPLQYALLVAILYFSVTLLWIMLSTPIAAELAGSIAELERFERIKGILYVLATSVFFFIFSWGVFRRISSSAHRLIRSQQQLLEAERNAITGLLASSVAHDCANVLTILRLNAERIRKALNQAGREDGKGGAAVDRLDTGISRLAELSSRMRMTGKSSFGGDPREFNLTKALEETLALLHGHSAIAGCSLEFQPHGEIKAFGYPILIHQLVMNLVLNAAEAISGKGTIRIEALRDQSINGVRIGVHDSGPGIPKGKRAQIFDPYYTTKRDGSGLGLLSVQSCVEIHSGQIFVGKSPELGGAYFDVTLPDLTSSSLFNPETPEEASQNRVPEIQNSASNGHGDASVHLGKPLPH